MGEKATGSYDLTVTVRGQDAEVFKGLPCGKANFKAVTWIGFTSLAIERTLFYLDNLKVSD